MKIQLIWAQDKNGGIGKNGKLPWHISEDLKNFKKITTKHPIIMGRITWESLPFKPLPNRRNIVLSRSNFTETECFSNINDCIQTLKNENVSSVFIIGGSSIYSNFLNIASDLHITLIHKNEDGIDCFFPKSLKYIKNNFQLSFQKDLSKDATYMHFIKK